MKKTKTKAMISEMYEAYAAVHGKTPDEMLLSDLENGGVGFSLFVNEMKREFHKQHPEAFFERFDQLVDREAFLKFVKEFKASNERA